MPDFVRRFGELDASGNPFLSSSRQSIITSLLSAGLVQVTAPFIFINCSLMTGLSCTFNADSFHVQI